MNGTAMREMTLDEWCQKLPEHHLVNIQLRELKSGQKLSPIQPRIDLPQFKRAVTLMQDAANRWMVENPHPKDEGDLEGYASAQNDFDEADRLLALIAEQENVGG